MNNTLAIGIDLGATKIAGALVTRAGEVLCARQTPTLAAQGATAVCERICTEIRALLEIAQGEVLGVGVGSPGLVDSRVGVVRGAVNLKWSEVPVAREIQQRLGNLPVYIENDANANAIGEGYFGSAIDSEHYALLTIGSGLGSGVVSHGRIVTGARSMAADLGHYSIDPENGLPCVCGHRGCAETIASGPGLVAAMRRILAAGSHASRLKDSTELTPDQIRVAARAGDAAALAAFYEVARVIGEISAIVAAVIDPDVILIGGGLGAAAADLIADDARDVMRRRLPPAQHVPPLRPATLPSPALGAACLVWSALTNADPSAPSTRTRAADP
jgi:glucokinase